MTVRYYPGTYVGVSPNYLRAFLGSGIAKMPPKEENTKEESPKVYV